MNFTEVVNEVLSIVKRPDKINDIRREVNAAINFCCNETELARDLMESSIVISSSLYTQNLALSDFTRFRKFCYLKPPAVKWYLTPTTPAKVFDNCSEACNSYYIAGSDVVIKTAALYGSLLAGWYTYPPVLTDMVPTFWLLDASPYMIIDRAASKVFANIGDDASANKHMALFVPAWLSARRDLASGVMP
jgi:hypothetical protein